MILRPCFKAFVLLAAATACSAWSSAAAAQTAPGATPTRLTLKEAEALALKNNPRLPAATLSAQAAGQVVTEQRSGFFPNFYASLTSVGALDNSRIAAGGLNNPIIFDRAAGGGTVSQLLTDFGRTGNLTASARLRAQSEDQYVQSTRADILLRVDRAYYEALRSLQVLRVAEETVKNRQVTLDQVSALTNAKLKSELDVSFAKVNQADAQLLLITAQNNNRAAQAEFSAALGFRDNQVFEQTEEGMPSPIGEMQPYVDQALQNRPELAAFRLRVESAMKFYEAEKDLSRPTVSALATAGKAAFNDDRMSNRFGAAGVNVNIPIFNGHLFSARRDEALLRAQSLQQSVRDAENEVIRSVRLAWFSSQTAFQRLAATAQLNEQATKSLELAQARYDLGLSSIVELNQAQLNLTAAEIAVASAKYEYQMSRAALEYQAGNLK